MSRAIALAITAIPLAALLSTVSAQQEQNGSNLWLGFSSGYINLGQMVDERTHHVRFGNTGKDVYFAMDAEARLKRHDLGLFARLLIAPTHYFRWPVDPEEPTISRWHWRPDARRASTSSVVWSCVSVGIRAYPKPWASIGAGPGLCSISGGSYLFGALPMHTPVLNANVRIMPEVADRMRIGVECGLDAANIESNSFAVLHEQAGQDPRTGRWIAPVTCGLGVKVRM